MAQTRLRAGDLRRRVTVQRKEETRDSIGDVTIEWKFEAERWASIRQLTAREIEIHSRPEAIATHRITMRHYPDLSVKQRLEHKGKYYNLMSVDDVYEGIHITVCIASEEVP
jgi:SPP1 family predicted phage head-tail adaptor